MNDGGKKGFYYVKTVKKLQKKKNLNVLDELFLSFILQTYHPYNKNFSDIFNQN